jgi:DNA-binding PadR family transcriptional regulator
VTKSEQRRVRLLEWLYDRGGDGRIAEFLGIRARPLIARPDVLERWDNRWKQDVTEWNGTLDALQRQGLIDGFLRRSSDFKFTTVTITDRGRAWVEDRRAHQVADQQAQQHRQADTTTRPTATAQDLDGHPLDRDAYAAQLRDRIDADRLGPRLELLREGEATTVAALLDELAGIYPDENLGRLARELAVRLYDRLNT